MATHIFFLLRQVVKYINFDLISLFIYNFIFLFLRYAGIQPTAYLSNRYLFRANELKMEYSPNENPLNSYYTHIFFFPPSKIMKNAQTSLKNGKYTFSFNW